MADTDAHGEPSEGLDRPTVPPEAAVRKEVDELRARVAELESRLARYDALLSTRAGRPEAALAAIPTPETTEKSPPRTPQLSPPPPAAQQPPERPPQHTLSAPEPPPQLATREVLEALIDETVPVDEIEAEGKTPPNGRGPTLSLNHNGSSKFGASVAEMIASQVLLEFSEFGSPLNSGTLQSPPCGPRGVKRPRPDQTVAAAVAAISSASATTTSSTGVEQPLPGLKRQRRGKLPEGATTRLREWLFAHLAHPYPSEEEKSVLGEQTGLSMNQINNWYTNARRRILPRERESQLNDAAQSSATAAAIMAVAQHSQQQQHQQQPQQQQQPQAQQQHSSLSPAHSPQQTATVVPTVVVESPQAPPGAFPTPTPGGSSAFSSASSASQSSTQLHTPSPQQQPHSPIVPPVQLASLHGHEPGSTASEAASMLAARALGLGAGMVGPGGVSMMLSAHPGSSPRSAPASAPSSGPPSPLGSPRQRKSERTRVPKHPIDV